MHKKKIKNITFVSLDPYTIDLVIFACLNFHEFPILGLLTKFRIREFSFFFSSAIIKMFSQDSWNLWICPPHEIRKN